MPSNIPNFDISGVLPPFLGEDLSPSPDLMAPYRTSIGEFIDKFATSQPRIQILVGFLVFREELRKFGLTQGFQWLDGSFLEDIESSSEKRPPNDLDLVTFAYIPRFDTETEASKFVEDAEASLYLFDPISTKSIFKCDAYFVDLNYGGQALVDQARYWSSLFSHKRKSYQWKGMLEVSLNDEGDEAALLESLKSRLL